MEITIKGEVKEIAALVVAIQEQQNPNVTVELEPGALIRLDGR